MSDATALHVCTDRYPSARENEWGQTATNNTRYHDT